MGLHLLRSEDHEVFYGWKYPKEGRRKNCKNVSKKNANKNSKICKIALHSSVINIHVSDKLQKTFPLKKATSR